jgi:hypothetical protein
MHEGGRTSLLLIAPALLAVAIAGYLLGHRHPSSRQPRPTHEASNGVVSVDYPTGWRLAGAPPALPGLAVGHPLVLAPAGEADRAALVVGQLAATPTDPLPEQLTDELGRVPDAEVVDLPANGQAYRYAQLTAPRLAAGLTLYAIPESATAETVALCYAATPSATEYIPACERIAATLTLLSPAGEVQAGGYLTPSASYARKIAAVVQALDRQLAQLRPGILPGVQRLSAAGFATSLAGEFSRADASLSDVQPPPAAASTHWHMIEALSEGRRAYTALAAAIDDGDPSAYATAQARVEAAEAALAASLRSFALIGYG